MSAVLPTKERSQIAKVDKQGVPTFEWSLTDSKVTDVVKLVAGPFNVLPVIFVPGIMGTNLRNKQTKEPVWRLDQGALGMPWGVISGFVGKGPGPRQKLLHPDRCEVDAAGAVPNRFVGTVYDKKTYQARGWGEIAEGSYHSFLLWLEETLNPIDRNPMSWRNYYQDQDMVSAPVKPGEKPKMLPGLRMGMRGQPFNAEKPRFEPVMSDELIAQSKFLQPVYAAGYNWLASNNVAAKMLSTRISEIIQNNNKGQYRCSQVILVTHSMGGLVARRCVELPNAADRVAGVIHGVMPAVGAAVAYRRCKVGMAEEDRGAGLVIGSTGKEVTAVFAQAPGALQLLPSDDYVPEWLRIKDEAGKVIGAWPSSKSGDPYTSIYLRRDRWWGLINEAWLSPLDGAPIVWSTFEKNIAATKLFHSEIGKSYHVQTFVYYGADTGQRSFERVTWRMRRGEAPDSNLPPSTSEVIAFKPEDLRIDGESPEYVGGRTERMPNYSPYGLGVPQTYETSYWQLHCELQDNAGDGTVPISSGAAPLRQGSAKVRQQFRLSGFGHELSYSNATAQQAVLYSIAKIAGIAKQPQ